MDSKKYNVIYADPPWHFSSRGARSGRYGDLPYGDMKLKDLKAMRVADIAADDCALHMWAVGSMMEEAFALGRAWGFRPIRVDKVWCKKTCHGNKHAVVAPYGMNDVEFIILFGKGKICSEQEERNQYTTQYVDCEYPGEHSRKPDHFRQLIDARWPKEWPRIELFCRQAPEGWDTWGNEAPNGLDLALVDIGDLF